MNRIIRTDPNIYYPYGGLYNTLFERTAKQSAVQACLLMDKMDGATNGRQLMFQPAVCSRCGPSCCQEPVLPLHTLSSRMPTTPCVRQVRLTHGLLGTPPTLQQEILHKSQRLQIARIARSDSQQSSKDSVPRKWFPGHSKYVNFEFYGEICSS